MNHDTKFYLKNMQHFKSIFEKSIDLFKMCCCKHNYQTHMNKVNIFVISMLSSLNAEHRGKWRRRVATNNFSNLMIWNQFRKTEISSFS